MSNETPTHSMHSLPTTPSTSTSAIPWWSGLSPAVSAELELRPVETLTLEGFDIAVIGAGVAGLSAALSASQMGARVLVLEREARAGSGATGRNAGILSAGINMSLSDFPLNSVEAAFWPETTQVLLSLVKEAANPGSLLKAHLTGALNLAESAYAVRRLAREARARVALGLHAELWTADQVTEATGGRLNVQSVVRALWVPEEGRIHPLTLLAYLARQIREAGGILAGCARVRDYQADQSGWQLTLADGRRIAARGLIEATGPTAQPSTRIYALAFAADLPASFPLFWDAAPYTYADFRPGDGRLTVSGGRYGRAGRTERDPVYHRRLVEAARHWLPELTDVEPLATWAVDLDVAADMVPQLRPLGDARPGIAIVGLGALGVLPGIILGRRAGHALMERLS